MQYPVGGLDFTHGTPVSLPHGLNPFSILDPPSIFLRFPSAVFFRKDSGLEALGGGFIRGDGTNPSGELKKNE
jgi:hypothetical protein